MKRKFYIATIRVAVISDNESEASDAISESLTHNLMPAQAILDWQYLPPNFNSLVYGGEIDPEDYIENSAFTLNT